MIHKKHMKVINKGMERRIHEIREKEQRDKTPTRKKLHERTEQKDKEANRHKHMLKKRAKR